MRRHGRDVGLRLGLMYGLADTPNVSEYDLFPMVKAVEMPVLANNYV